MRVRCVTLLAGGELTADRSAGTGLRAPPRRRRAARRTSRPVACPAFPCRRQGRRSSAASRRLPAGNPCRADVEHSFRAANVLMLGVSLSGIEDVRAGRVGKRSQPATAEFFGCWLVLAAPVAQPRQHVGPPAAVLRLGGLQPAFRVGGGGRADLVPGLWI